MCEVLPLKVIYILLGLPWFWDRNVEYAGRYNTYSFSVGKMKYTLASNRDEPLFKLKKCSFVFCCVLPSEGILGHAPTSRQSNFCEEELMQHTLTSWTNMIGFWSRS